MANKITVKFEAKGAKALKEAIDSLGEAQARLEGRMKKFSGTNRKVGTGLVDTTNKGRLVNNAFATMRSRLLLVSFGFTLVAGSIGKAVKLFGEQERAALKLNNALGFNSVRLRELAAEMQQLTAVGDEVIINAQSLLASFVKSEEEVARLTTTILDLSAGLGIDLNSAANLVGKTIGSTTNSMSRYGVSVIGAANSTARINSLITSTDILFGNMSKTVGQSTLGSVERLSASFGDLIESVGELLTSIGAISVMKGITGVFNLLNSTISGLANVMPFYNDKLKESTMLSEKDAKAQNKRIQNIRGVNDLLTARAKVANIEKEIEAITSKLVSSEKERVEVKKEEKKVVNDQIDSQINLNLVYDKGFMALDNANDALKESSNLVEINIGNQEDFNYVLSSSVNEMINLTKETEINIEKTDQSNESVNALAKGYAKVKTEGKDLLILQKLLSVARAKEQELLSSQLAHVTQEQQSIRNLKVAKGEMFDVDAKREMLAIKEIEIEERLDKQLITKTQRRILLNQVELEGIAITQQANEERLKSVSIMVSSAQAITNALNQGVTRQVNHELAELRKRDSYKNASSTKQQKLEEEIQKKYEDKRKALFVAEKALALSEIYINTSLGATKALGQQGAFGIPMSTYIKAQGAINAAIVLAQPMPQYEYGGLIGGRRHSAGGTVIEAEQGEFVVNRNAVESIGVDNLEMMNSTGSSGVTVNITGNVMSSDFVENELAEKIQEAVRKGVDFGVS